MAFQYGVLLVMIFPKLTSFRNEQFVLVSLRRSQARSKGRSIHAPNLTDELRAAFESVWFGRLGFERPTRLSSAGSVALCDIGAAADSHGALVMC